MKTLIAASVLAALMACSSSDSNRCEEDADCPGGTCSAGSCTSTGGSSSSSGSSGSTTASSQVLCDVSRPGRCICYEGPAAASSTDPATAVSSCAGSFSCCYRFSRPSNPTSSCVCDQQTAAECKSHAVAAGAVIVSRCPFTSGSSSSSGTGSSSGGCNYSECLKTCYEAGGSNCGEVCEC